MKESKSAGCRGDELSLPAGETLDTALTFRSHVFQHTPQFYVLVKRGKSPLHKAGRQKDYHFYIRVTEK